MAVIDVDSIRGYWDDQYNTLTCVECTGDVEITADLDVEHILEVDNMEEGKRYFCDQCKKEIVA